jgi:hypothetical protein
VVRVPLGIGGGSAGVHENNIGNGGKHQKEIKGVKMKKTKTKL